MKFWIFLCFLIFSSMSYGQVILDIPLRSQFKKEAIKRNEIKSVVVFAEENEAGIVKSGGGVSGKILDIEFDSTGQVFYKHMVDASENRPFIKSKDDCRFEYFNFDDKGELLYLYRENISETYELVRNFNSDGNLIQFITTVDGEVTSNSNFKWEDGKMVKYTEESTLVNYKYSKIYYDENGRFSKFDSEDYHLLHEYIEHGDTVILTETIADSSKTTSVETYIYLKPLKDHYTYYTYQNENGELILEMKVSYDDAGNATSYNLINFDKYESEFSDKPSVNYRIENIYDERDLLISRRFYCKEDYEDAERLVRIERFLYDKEPLIVKYEKGGLARH